MAAHRLLVFGFSNVATTSGFSLPTIEMLTSAMPGLEAYRVGLGALQPQAVPPYLRLATETLGPFSHVLLEINASAFATHPLSSEARGRELLADTLLAVQDSGADAIFMLHYRRWKAPLKLDFDDLIRRFCAELDLPLIDLAAGFVDRHGVDTVHSWLRDDVHTTVEGGEVMAEALAPFLQDQLSREPWLAARTIPMPDYRRRTLDLAPHLPGFPRETFDCIDLPLPYVRLDDGRDAAVDLGREVFAQGLTHLFHAGGGRVQVHVDGAEPPTLMTTIDPFSYYTRIGILAFDFYRGRQVRTLSIAAPEPADDIQLRQGERVAPLRSYLGPLLTLEPV